ncbi:SCO6745 family protein [Kribbella sp. CWNU-51]
MTTEVIMATDYNERARRLRNAVEPVAAGVYFAPEAHAAYGKLGFDSTEVVGKDGISRPEMKAYFTSRGASLGHVPGEVVAAAFGCFNPKVVVPGVEAGWRITDREPILEARLQGATEMLQRVLGEKPEGLGRVTDLLRRAADAAPWAGRAIYSGLRSEGFPGTPIGDMWRAADLVREHRGDSHVISWAVGGVDAMEILLLTEQYWGVPARAYAPSRGWTDADMDAGFARLQQRGLMTSDERITDAGRAFREEIEVRTDELERPLLDALGNDLDELLEHLDAWSEAIIDAGSYPQRIAGVYNVGGGPHFGSGLTIDTAAAQYGEKA